MEEFDPDYGPERNRENRRLARESIAAGDICTEEDLKIWAETGVYPTKDDESGRP